VGIRHDLWQDDLTQVEMTAPRVVTPDLSLRETLRAMKKAAAGCVLVCREGTKGSELVGIFTERDYIKRVLARGADFDAPIKNYMTESPVTVRGREALGDVIRTMYQGGYRHLPVVDDDGQPVGTVSVKRIVQYLVDHYPTTVYNLPPQPRQVQEAREGA
jgi:CBS domain-containing protein